MSLYLPFGEPADVLICGASRGIGLALCQQLLARDDVRHVWAVARRATQSPGLAALAEQYGERFKRRDLDACDEEALTALALERQQSGAPLRLVISTLGVLQQGEARAEKHLGQLNLAGLMTTFSTNAFAPLLLLKHLLPQLRGRQPCCFAALSARVGSIGDNRLGGWYSYRASKAALNQLLHTASIELRRLNPQACLLLLHPGTTDTELSRPFQANVPAERLFSPAFVAERLLTVIAARTPADSGSFRDWNDQPVPW
ncbi:SDR family NAD(P)-dependent oxidoreductase [Pseudomonas sp. NW5]|uniref:SDR family NAD(P)-dependent oxidoreductase n=1 Tax=Pseudomonas sp. NW5 TaxID=2934934 RepID=UPI0020202BC9|nr:SDR family NAD(P)-dependent oxidoreductase [Pseudomonas sp. NW5]MCL7462719.1 SDR family NAD(P)-dependent oxidoreductase [Pseudomonas sp. NW5]